MQSNDTTKTKTTGAMKKQGESTTGKDTSSKEKDTTKETEYTKTRKTDIAQLVKTNPEMPEEIKLNRGTENN